MSIIAVLIPTFKPGSYLEECLSCLENQTLDKNRFQVYIALNGPSLGYDDYVKALIKKFSFKVNYYVLNKAGVSNARNFLLDNSESDYVTFIDDDDLISDTYLESLLSVSNDRFIAIANVKNFSCSRDVTSLNYIGKCFESLPNVEKSLFKARKYYSSPCAKLLHRSIIGDNKFNVNFSVGEDSLFMSQLSNVVAGVAKADEGAIYFVRQREGSASRRKVNKIIEIKRLTCLLFLYLKMLVSLKYDFLFISSRMVATVIHLKRLFMR